MPSTSKLGDEQPHPKDKGRADSEEKNDRGLHEATVGGGARDPNSVLRQSESENRQSSTERLPTAEMVDARRVGSGSGNIKKEDEKGNEKENIDPASLRVTGFPSKGNKEKEKQGAEGKVGTNVTVEAKKPLKRTQLPKRLGGGGTAGARKKRRSTLSPEELGALVGL